MKFVESDEIFMVMFLWANFRRSTRRSPKFCATRRSVPASLQCQFIWRIWEFALKTVTTVANLPWSESALISRRQWSCSWIWVSATKCWFQYGKSLGIRFSARGSQFPAIWSESRS
uniref:Uncharacterized protein n=1 Tax=Phlebotomus papatasi TaxID=29031 RepID=A0A1B0GMG2_PHLPP